jgi:four helix bundle protein
MKRHNFKKLQIWNDSMELIQDTYKITSKFPDFEKFGLRSQLNRCAVSIASNIAEGSSKSSNKHFIQFLEISLGSAFEWETQMITSCKLKYLSEKEFCNLEEKINKIQKKISNFIDKLHV